LLSHVFFFRFFFFDFREFDWSFNEEILVVNVEIRESIEDFICGFGVAFFDDNFGLKFGHVNAEEPELSDFGEDFFMELELLAFLDGIGLFIKFLDDKDVLFG
jgi:hypothetical protein